MEVNSAKYIYKSKIKILRERYLKERFSAKKYNAHVPEN